MRIGEFEELHPDLVEVDVAILRIVFFFFEEICWVGFVIVRPFFQRTRSSLRAVLEPSRDVAEEPLISRHLRSPLSVESSETVEPEGVRPIFLSFGFLRRGWKLSDVLAFGDPLRNVWL